eukprot:jgi/Botrbrau1/1611/Bobra.0185s0026.1
MTSDCGCNIVANGRHGYRCRLLVSFALHAFVLSTAKTVDGFFFPFTTVPITTIPEDRSKVPIWQQPVVLQSAVGPELQVLPPYVSTALCLGLFIQNRSFDSVWNTELGPVQGPFHDLFSYNSSSSNKPGRIYVKRSSVEVSIIAWPVDDSQTEPATFVFSSVYTGPHFGCQFSVPDLPRIEPVFQDDDTPFKPHVFPSAEAGSPGAFPDVDYDRIVDTVDAWFKDPEYNTFAVTIIHKGKLVLERYAGDRGISKDTPLLSASTCKSISNAFTGLRVGDGAIKLTSLTQGPGWSPDEVLRRNLTISQLARMVEGFNVSESEARANNAIFQWSVAAGASQFPQVYPPGTVWDYFSPDINLLSYNLRLSFQEKDGTSSENGDLKYWNYVHNRLWKKIGVSSIVFTPDAVGTSSLTGLCMGTALDYARFGQLYLQNGIWEGEELISPKWIKYSLKPTPQNTSPYSRGDGWWLNPYPGVTPPDHYAAQGVHGQWIAIIPSQELVITHHGWAEFMYVRGRGGTYFGNISASFPGGKS